MAIRVIRFLAQLKEVIANGGRVPMSFLASGTPTGSKFIRDDGTLATPSGGGSSAGTVGQVQCAGTVAGTFAVGAHPAAIDPATGAMTTRNNTLDDGSGNATLSGGLSVDTAASTTRLRGISGQPGWSELWIGGDKALFGGAGDIWLGNAQSLITLQVSNGSQSAWLDSGGWHIGQVLHANSRALIDGATDDGVTALQVGGNGNIAATGLNCSSVFAASYLQSNALVITGALADGTYPIASGAGSCTIDNGVITAIS